MFFTIFFKTPMAGNTSDGDTCHQLPAGVEPVMGHPHFPRIYAVNADGVKENLSIP